MGGMGEEEFGVADFDRPGPADLAYDTRHRRRAAAAAPDPARMLDVDPVEGEGKAVRIALAADLAVADDIDPGSFHIEDREDRRVILRVFEPGLGDPPDV